MKIMDIISKDDFDKLSTADDFKNLREKISKEMKRVEKQLLSEFPKAKNIDDLKVLIILSMRLNNLQSTYSKNQDMINYLEITDLNHKFKKLVGVLIANTKDDEVEDKEMIEKLNKLECEIKEATKSRSLFGNLSFSLFKNDVTGLGIDG